MNIVKAEIIKPNVPGGLYTCKAVLKFNTASPVRINMRLRNPKEFSDALQYWVTQTDEAVLAALEVPTQLPLLNEE